jgi:hypothetical protein
MKKSLTVLSLHFAAALPSAFALDLAGVHLPAALNPLTAFAAFAGSCVLLLLTGDYRRRPTISLPSPRTGVFAAKASHPLAA